MVNDVIANTDNSCCCCCCGKGKQERFKEYPKLQELIRLKVSVDKANVSNKAREGKWGGREGLGAISTVCSDY